MIIGNPISTGLGDAIFVLTIITAPGATVSAVLNDQTMITTASSSGVAVLKFRKEGTWTVTVTDGINTKTTTVEVSSKKAGTITFFPAEPSSYSLIGTYTSSQTWTAPEDGYFQIEIFGASGKGGDTQIYYQSPAYYGGGGGGGGGGGYACSRVKMKKGDTISITRGGVGYTSSATINSSLESYSKLQVTSGAKGGNGTATSTSASKREAGTGGAGGTASGGNYSNRNGSKGADGTTCATTDTTEAGSIKGAGGKAGYTGGNAGGAGGGLPSQIRAGTNTSTGASGSAGFIKIYRGNTNVA